MPPAGSGARGGRGKLKFQPKSSVRRSKEEREAAEKKEQAAIKAEEIAAEKERKKAEQRAARGRGRGGNALQRGRGGTARGGVSGWMSGGGSSMSGAMIDTPARDGGVSLPGFGGGAGGDYKDGAFGRGASGGPGGGGAGASRGAVGSSDVKPEGSAGFSRVSLPTRKDGTQMRMINIEHINLVSDDEDDASGSKGRPSTRTPAHGLPPVRAPRHAHTPRKAKVNIDLSSTPEQDKDKAKEVAADVTTAATQHVPDAPVKIEPEEDASQNVKVESPKVRPKRGRGKAKAKSSDVEMVDVTVEDAQAAPSTQADLAKMRPVSDLIKKQSGFRPTFVRDDCNFICSPRPPGWESKEDTENWERNIQKKYALYEELSFPEKMRYGVAGDDGDVEMTDAAAVGEDKAKSRETTQIDGATKHGAKPDRKQDLVYVFHLAPEIPGIEGLRSREDIERMSRRVGFATDEEGKENKEDDDVTLMSRPAATEAPASPKKSRSRSPESRRKKAGSKSSGAATDSKDPKIKLEEPEILVENKGEGESQVKAMESISLDDLPTEEEIRSGKKAPGRERPGYIGDLVVYNTGEATIDWGGLPLRLKLGQQTDMLQQVLLTSANVTKEEAIEAEEAGKKVKREGASGDAGAGVGASSGTDAPTGSGGGGGAEGGDTGSSAAVAEETEAAGTTPPDTDRAYAMGLVAGIFTAVPDFGQIFGVKWRS